ncbi:STN domain-containing protein [Colwellia sp. MSW7]|uniref:STN domain-containing protein n=1 Tax=Colwellia maritima TaxID=2912588 RepID=A0ABS9X3K9_9GAMM|nr:STN domain-containing protein [Colwellia maritima]MCI2284818.1 STN domain-containing protein [Colwellia maritima]
MFNRLLNHNKNKYLQFTIVFNLLLFTTPLLSYAAESYRFNLPAMNAATALDKLADISGYSLLYPFDDSLAIVTNPLVGTYSLSDALAKLLLNTPLNAIATEKRVIAVSSILKKNNSEDLDASTSSPSPKSTELTKNIEKKPNKEIEPERIQIIGSRRINRSPSDALAPLDIIHKQDINARGNNDMLSTLSNVIPSYNVSQEAISDAGTLIRPKQALEAYLLIAC